MEVQKNKQLKFLKYFMVVLIGLNLVVLLIIKYSDSTLTINIFYYSLAIFLIYAVVIALSVRKKFSGSDHPKSIQFIFILNDIILAYLIYMIVFLLVSQFLSSFIMFTSLLLCIAMHSLNYILIDKKIQGRYPSIFLFIAFIFFTSYSWVN